MTSDTVRELERRNSRFQKSGINEIQCNYCDQSKRFRKIRFREHFVHLRYGRRKKIFPKRIQLIILQRFYCENFFGCLASSSSHHFSFLEIFYTATVVSTINITQLSPPWPLGWVLILFDEQDSFISTLMFLQRII